MTSALTCITANSVGDDDIGTLFGTVCGLGDGSQCDGITSNGTTGKYGAYSMCAPKEQLSYALNEYYEAQKKAGNGASACDFKGSATTQKAAAITGDCKGLISQAGAAGTGTVTSAPTGTGAAGSAGAASGSGSAASASGSSTGSSAAGMLTIPAFNFGLLHLSAYVAGAVLTGAGMILL